MRGAGFNSWSGLQVKTRAIGVLCGAARNNARELKKAACSRGPCPIGSRESGETNTRRQRTPTRRRDRSVAGRLFGKEQTKVQFLVMAPCVSGGIWYTRRSQKAVLRGESSSLS